MVDGDKWCHNFYLTSINMCISHAHKQPDTTLQTTITKNNKCVLLQPRSTLSLCIDTAVFTVSPFRRRGTGIEDLLEN